jgi:membrane associated rhomboid family serine protease
MFLLPSNPPLSSNYPGLISAWIQLLMLGIFALSVISLLTGIITYLVFKFKNRKGLIMEYSIKLIQKGVILLVLLFIIYNIIQFIAGFFGIQAHNTTMPHPI